MTTLDEITKQKQRVGEALTRVDAQREKLVSQLSDLETVERVLARYSKGAQPRKTSSAKLPTTKAAGGYSGATTRTPAQCDCKVSSGQSQLTEPQRSGSRPGNRQDAAGNRRC